MVTESTTQGKATLEKKQIHANEFIWEPAKPHVQRCVYRQQIETESYSRVLEKTQTGSLLSRGIAGVSASKKNMMWMFYEHVFECRCVQKMLIQWCSERKAWSTQTKTFIKKHSVWLLIQWKSSASGEFCGKSARLDALEPSVLYIYANLIFISLHLRTQRLIVLCLCSEENRENDLKINSFICKRTLGN